MGRDLKYFEQRLGSLSLATFIFVAILCAVEYCAPTRSVLPTVIQHQAEVNYFAPRPYIMFSTAPSTPLIENGTFNSLGFHGPAPALPKPPSETRIALIGGSTVVSGTPTLAELLERQLREQLDDRIRVYNFGVVTSITRMDLARLVFMVERTEPDLVLFYGGGNDIIMSYQGDPRPGYPPNYVVYESNPLNTDVSFLRDFIGVFARRSRILRGLAPQLGGEWFFHLNELRREEGWGTQPWAERVADEYVHDVREASRISTGIGAKFIAVFQPLVYFKPTRSDIEARWAFPALCQHAEWFRARARSQLATTGSAFAWRDESDLFQTQSSQAFFDGIHIEQEMYPKVAARLFEAVRLQLANGFTPAAKAPQS